MSTHSDPKSHTSKLVAVDGTEFEVEEYALTSDTTNKAGTNGHKPYTPTTSIDLLKYEAEDDGNALAMRDLYGDKFLYVPKWAKWMQYTGTHYEEVSIDMVARAAVETLNLRRHAAIDGKRDDILKAAKPSHYRVSSCVLEFRKYVGEEDISVFDFDPNELNCGNGVVNMRTGTITNHQTCQRFTYCLPVEYKPDADMSLWNNFIHDALGNDEIVHHLQKCVGYSFTGHTNVNKAFYIYGPPRSGKGTFTDTILALLPRPVGTEVDFNTFTAKRDAGDQGFDLAPLKPSRFIIASESNRYQSINPAKMKQITGENLIRCSFKHGQHFEYKPQFKVWLVSNHPITADPDDDALWGRFQVFTFPHSFLGREDVDLKERLREPQSLEGVLRWVVEGAMAWYQDKRLIPPQAVEIATKQQRDAQDYVKQWLGDCCILGNEQDFTTSASLMASYNAWCKENNVKPERTNDLFGSLVKRFGCKPDRTYIEQIRTRIYRNIKVMGQQDSRDSKNEVSYASEKQIRETENQASQVSQVSQVSHKLSITPAEVVRYPYDVLEVFKHHTVKPMRVACLRGHHSAVYLPYYNQGEWEMVCEDCFPGLRASNGASCE